MQSDQQLFPPNPLLFLSNLPDGSHMHNAANTSAFDGTILASGAEHARSFHGVQFHSSEVCPKNFIIFDQTENRSQIMFHPAVAPRFCCPDLDIYASCIHDNDEREEYIKKELRFSPGEDSDDIDALLSLEEEEKEEKVECDDEEISTARTHGNYESDSSDSCSSYGSKPKKSRNPLRESSVCGTSNNSEKKRKMRKMVNALRGIVPGGNGMNTAAVLDEAVRYLKSLKVASSEAWSGNLMT